MSFCFKYHIIFLSFFIVLVNCQLQEPTRNHGILFLENRSAKLNINDSNKNDVLNIIGQPHSKSINNDNQWIYIERTITKGDYHKLGRNVLKTNNVLILDFDKYGVLKDKKFLDKNDKKKLTFSKNSTANEISKKSFVEGFLSSIREKMYGNK
jgi:outer membrane protein assembly factor BamE (lipoprotein component of BamABCDE complex)|tara:strand:- start:187 stop:645 length:459 start_codon:yes stop_codon:yes gene_type:complete